MVTRKSATAPKKTGAKATGTSRGRGRASAPVDATTPRNRAAAHLGGASKSADDGQSSGQGAGDNMMTLPKGATDATASTAITIETVAIPGRGGRQQSQEKYPFSDLTQAKKDGKTGEMVGPSFLIVEEDNPENVLAAARKRHKGKTFISRKMEGGVRVWLGPLA